MESTGDLAIGASARRLRNRRIAVGGLGAVLILVALWLYLALSPRDANSLESSYPVRVHCENCGAGGERRLDGSEPFPLLCPECRQRTLRAMWKCRKCGREFDPPMAEVYLVCPSCQSMAVGSPFVAENGNRP